MRIPSDIKALKVYVPGLKIKYPCHRAEKFPGVTEGSGEPAPPVEIDLAVGPDERGIASQADVVVVTAAERAGCRAWANRPGYRHRRCSHLHAVTGTGIVAGRVVRLHHVSVLRARFRAGIGVCKAGH